MRGVYNKGLKRLMGSYVELGFGVWRDWGVIYTYICIYGEI